MDGSPHLNADALRALVRAAGAQKQVVALQSDIEPSRFSHYLAGRRVQVAPQIVDQLAAGLTAIHGFPIHPRALTCHCGNPEAHRQEKAQ